MTFLRFSPNRFSYVCVAYRCSTMSSFLLNKSSIWVGLLFSLILFSCGKEGEETVFPEYKAITESVYASGLVKAKNQYEAFTMASGPIQEVFVKEGDTIKAGAPILLVYNEAEKLRKENAQLAQSFADQQANQTRLRDLELAISFAKNKLYNDSLLWVRTKNLWDKGIGTAVELEQRELNYRNSKTSYESSLLRYRDLKREIEYNSKSAGKNLAISQVVENEFTLKSKIDGVVFSLLKEVGEMANPQTPLAIIGSPGDFILELQVDEYDIARVEVGQPVIVSMDSYKGETFEAEVTKVYPIMDSKSKTFTLEAVFTKAPPKLYPNLSLEANVVTKVSLKTLVIPRNYLLGENQVITSDGDTLTVKVGIKNFQFAEILEGVSNTTELIQPNQ
ncbi:efflux RND transporter periplasmic adaptor subunit [Algoriphagus taiwanensis]|uniref:Efflux RND transporter periplasmic adaptor subunit n=2 Tax=Algoriphagus taiwanensis TaxID=1445656 RepID=A0ABQ6Q3I2_9BACT|nr:efflux RND transporter periplasmic adaptor subunit [Algoriphagus taiwanensis]